MADIFISYARADRAKAQKLAEALERRGWTVWWDARLRVGEIWDEVIETQLKAARTVVVLWSESSVKSRWVRKEARVSDGRHILAPAFLHAVDLPLEFSDVQAADLISWEGNHDHPGFLQLVEDIQAVLGGGAPQKLIDSESDQPCDAATANAQVRPLRGKPSAKRWGHYLVLLLVLLLGIIAAMGLGYVLYERRNDDKLHPPPPPVPKSPDESVPKPADKPVFPPPSAPSQYKPGQTLRDCDICPEMVVVPAGSFDMGSADDNSDASDNEKPQHRIDISQSFAVGAYEVTFAEWDACVAGGGCGSHHPDDKDWGHGKRPVINVSWRDAKVYVAWLSKETGNAYRLLTEAEWEYVARAGTNTYYWWGNDNGHGNANCAGCGSRWDAQQTAPVGSFAANRFGIYDVAGNVREWVEDIWHESYTGAPTDGSPWTDDKGKQSSLARVLRGGSWNSTPWECRSASRFKYLPSQRLAYGGFRVARTLN